MRTGQFLGVVCAALLGLVGTIGSSKAQDYAVQHAGKSAPQVYLLRGLADVFSYGMNDLAVKMQRRGIHAVADSYTNGDAIANDIAAKYRAGNRAPVVLIGHSLGADSVIGMGYSLQNAGVPVALIITYGPYANLQTPSGNARIVNYFQYGMYGGAIARSAGYRGQLLNMDLSSDPNINHFNIDKSARLHADTIGRVASIVGGGRSAPKPAAPAAAPAVSALPSDGARAAATVTP